MEAKATRIQALQVVTEEVSTFVCSCFHSQQFILNTKDDGSVVTNVDTEAELKARNLVLERFPNDGFLGEEHGEIKGTSGWRWVVDPIDGTTSFTRGVPLFGTLIGLEYHGKPIAGVANLPAIGESISAVIGEGAWHTQSHQDSPVKACVSSTTSLDDAMVCTTTFDYYRQTNSSPIFMALLDAACSTRGWSDCFAFLLVCTGRIDALVEPLLYAWDIIPWLPIIEESGGKYSSIISGGIVSTPAIHTTLYDALHANITN